MGAEDENSSWIQIPIKDLKELILQCCIEVNQNIPAKDDVVTHKKGVYTLYQVISSESGFLSQEIMHPDKILRLINVKILGVRDTQLFFVIQRIRVNYQIKIV